MVPAQVVISGFVEFRHTSGSVLTVQSLLGILSLSLSLSTCSPAHSLSLSLAKINKLKKKNLQVNKEHSHATFADDLQSYVFLLL